jgi:prevent-host-death family protein
LEVAVFERYSIAEARDRFTSIVRDVEEKVAGVELTRRGEPVAVLLSVREYRRLSGEKGFWDAYLAFREGNGLDGLGIEPEDFEGLRDASPGREAGW